jgi:hypothetical protein
MSNAPRTRLERIKKKTKPEARTMVAGALMKTEIHNLPVARFK